MIFRSFLDNALGSYAKVRILRYLLAENLPASENEIARILDLSPMTVNRVMKGFMEINLISPAKIGAATAWRLNKDSWSFRAIEPVKNIRVDPLKDLLALLKLDNYRWIKEAYLFGSVAEGTEESTSDIDLLVIIETSKKLDKKLREDIESLAEFCENQFGNRLSVKILAENEIRGNKRLIENARKWVKLR